MRANHITCVFLLPFDGQTSRGGDNTSDDKRIEVAHALYTRERERERERERDFDHRTFASLHRRRFFSLTTSFAHSYAGHEGRSIGWAKKQQTLLDSSLSAPLAIQH